MITVVNSWKLSIIRETLWKWHEECYFITVAIRDVLMKLVFVIIFDLVNLTWSACLYWAHVGFEHRRNKWQQRGTCPYLNRSDALVT